MTHVVVHATAYDDLPSGARARAVGLAAAWLRGGHRVTVLAPKGLDFGTLVAAELGEPPPSDRYAECPTGLDPRRPWTRALTAPRTVAKAIPRDAELFVTDYHPVPQGVPTALTVHDLRYLVAPEGENPARVAVFRSVFPRLARSAAVVVVPSKAIARVVPAQLGVDAKRVVVSPNAAARTWRDAASGDAPGAHFVTIGIAEPRKRFAVLVEALRRARARGDVLPVVAVGRTSRAAETVLRGARDLVDAGALRWAGTPGDAELVALVRDAAALLHPSSYEGFGLPVLEALACGTPVVATRDAAVEEVAGDLATWVDRPDADAWADALLDASRRADRRAAGCDARRARAAAFTWDAAASAILSAAAAAV